MEIRAPGSHITPWEDFILLFCVGGVVDVVAVGVVVREGGLASGAGVVMLGVDVLIGGEEVVAPVVVAVTAVVDAVVVVIAEDVAVEMVSVICCTDCSAFDADFAAASSLSPTSAKRSCASSCRASARDACAL